QPEHRQHRRQRAGRGHRARRLLVERVEQRELDRNLVGRQRIGQWHRGARGGGEYRGGAPRHGDDCGAYLPARAVDRLALPVPAGGGQGSFSVNATASCAWTATSNAPWISVTSGASGSGQGTVQFSAAANPGPARSGTITAAGQTFTINQDVGCTATVTPEALTSPADGGSQPVNVSTGAECAWTAVSNVPWISSRH